MNELVQLYVDGPPRSADAMATSASGRRSPPWGKLEGCTAGHESFDVYTRSARRRGGWWYMCGPHSLTRDGHHGTLHGGGARLTHAACARYTGHLHHHTRD